MNATINIPMPIIDSVTPAGPLTVRVTWRESARPTQTEIVDLGPLINSLKFYRKLRNDPTLFGTVHVIDDGNAIAWGEDDAIDMAATSVERLAGETMTADDLKTFISTHGFTHGEAAAILGYNRRTIEGYLSGEHPIPRVVAFACYGYTARKQREKLGIPLRQGTHGVVKANASSHSMTEPVWEVTFRSRNHELEVAC